jgi:two-component system, OmpR family, sensor histidine kinase BaeS
MIKSLWIKFILLLFAVSIISLSAALILRNLMIHDFREFLEGEQEDRVYWVTADLESTYDTQGRWQDDAVRRAAVWAYMLGFETRLLNLDGSLVMDTAHALKSLPPLAQQRIAELSVLRSAEESGSFVPYPLFIRDREIGRLEVRFILPKRERVYIERSNTFLLIALGVLGGLVVLLSVVFSNRMTRPLKKMATVAASISDGDFSKRVDVTAQDELGRLSRAFNRMADTLQTQELLRKKLIANAAHELRTPLTAIQGEIEGMMDGLIPVNKEQLQSLREEAERLRKMLEGMEELTQAQASRLALRKKPVEMRPFLENIAERIARQAVEKGIVVLLECQEETKAYADPDRLSQIVINLVSNALKAVEKGGTVTISAAHADSTATLEIRDTGRGIKEEDLPFIFERFYSGSSGGLGLGLAIVRELVDAHGGTIGVKSTSGAGSTFSVLLPDEPSS